MKHNSMPILEIHVEIDPVRTVTLTGEINSVRMIPFKGTVTGPIFSGTVEPCGVDTQIINPKEVRHMSAQCMLTGTDMDGRNCHIYVENTGWLTDSARPKPFRAVLTFIADSPVLSPLRHQNQFVGEGLRDENGMCIRIYELGDSE